MSESLITISLVGFAAGFAFSVPVAGPISFLIVSNALKGKSWYCIKAAIGAAFADFFYVFIAMIGLTRFFKYYQPLIPYILMVGSVFLAFVAWHVYKSKLKMSDFEENPAIPKKYSNRRGFRTGFLINFLNPTLFFGWLTSSFITLSLATSLGFNLGGLESSINHSIQYIERPASTKDSIKDAETLKYLPPFRTKMTTSVKPHAENNNRWYHFSISALYAFWLSIGSILWFYLMSKFIVRNRHRMNISFINYMLRIFGFILFIFSAYLLGRGIDIVI